MCANCGSINAPGEQFCSICGYSLAGGPTTPILPTAQPPPPVGGALSQKAPPPATVPGARRTTGGLGAGDLLGGRYRVARLVGKGGFGAVYEAVDERFQARRVVAIKEMSDAHLNLTEKAQAIQDFRHEADLLVQLHHPNLPNVSDFFEEAGKAYLVMEFVEGKTLEKEQEDAGGPLDEPRVMAWALQLCEVLGYLHTRVPPIIFRDLKPSNVMVTPDDAIKLIDFGIARVFKSAASKDTTSLGSRGYAPLEQYGRGQSDARSDIYALGATLYDLLTKTTPADAATRRVNPLAFKAPRQLNPRLSQATERVILKAMAEDPKDRYQSAAEMYQAIASSGVVPVTNMAMRTMIPPPPSPGLPPLPTAPTPSPAPASHGAPSLPSTPVRYPASPVPAPGAPGKPGVSRRRLLVGGLAGAAVVALGGVGAYFFLKNRGSGSGSGNQASGMITVNFIYSTEKETWMRAATDAFHQSGATLNGKQIQVVLDERGSVEGHNRILSGASQPTAWSPASFLELNQLLNDWQQAHPGQDIIVNNSGDLEPKSLFSSPLVFAIWKERADVLQQHYGQGKIDWPAIHDALTLKNGWTDIGGQANWGLVKFGQTRPDSSNSGLLTITLLAYSYFMKQRGLTKDEVDDPGFLAYFGDIEGAVTAFGRSSGTFAQDVVIPMGPPAYDIVTTYENLALTLQAQAVQRWNQPWQVFYPSLNILSDHPFAILQGSWVNAEQQMAATVFRDFLLSETQQRAALSSGFRPSNLNVPITTQAQNNPFLGQSSDIHIQSEIQPLAQALSGDVTNELIRQWTAQFGQVQTTTGG